MKNMIWRRILLEPLEIPNNWLLKWNQWRRIDLRPKSQFDVRILIFFLISRIVKFWDFFQNAPIFLKFALLSNSNLLNKTQASYLLSEAAIFFCERTYANFKKNYIIRQIRFLPLNHLSCPAEVFFSDSPKSEESNRFYFFVL